MNNGGYQGTTTHVSRVGTSDTQIYSSPPRTKVTDGMAVSRVMNNGPQFSPVPPHSDGSPRKTNPVTYEQKDGLTIEAGGVLMDVRGSRSNSPVKHNSTV